MKGPACAQWRLPRRSSCGFTGADLLSVLAIISVLAMLTILPWTRARQRAGILQCTSNLQQISRALALYANEHGDKLPQGVAMPGVELWWSYKAQVKSYLASDSAQVAKVFTCPVDRGYSDPQPFAQTARFANSSYPYNAVTVGDAPNIAGWPLHEVVQPKRTLLAMEWSAHAPLSWHKSRTGKRNLPFYCDAESVCGFVDGHVALTKIYYDGSNAAYTRDPIAGYDYRFSGK